jgi:hypothetical protein
VPIEPEGLSDEPFESVSEDGISKGLSDRDSKAWPAAMIGCDKHREQSVAEAQITFEDSFELPVGYKSAAFGKRKTLQIFSTTSFCSSR